MTKQRWFRITLNAIVILVIGLCAIAVLSTDYAWPQWYWVPTWIGLGETTTTSTTTTVTKDTKSGEETVTEITTVETLPGKTLWDWLELLIIPAALGFFALWFNRRQRESEIRQTEERAWLEREIATEHQRAEAFQSYLDHMTEFLLEKELRASNPGSDVREIARARTLTVLRELDGERKGLLVRFLHQSKLISKENTIIGLSGANLLGVDLSGNDISGNRDRTFISYLSLADAQLSGTDLREADLTEAKLSDASLVMADLSNANLTNAHLMFADLRCATLTGTNLKNANLMGANLSSATGVTEEQLADVGSLVGAIMPKGKEYDGRFDDNE